MIRVIHYSSAELKTKIDVIPGGCFNYSSNTVSNSLEDVYVMVCDIIERTIVIVMQCDGFCYFKWKKTDTGEILNMLTAKMENLGLFFLKFRPTSNTTLIF